MEAVHQAHGGGDEAALGERVEVGQDAAVLGSTETRRPDSKSSATITPWVRYSACGANSGSCRATTFATSSNDIAASPAAR